MSDSKQMPKWELDGTKGRITIIRRLTFNKISVQANLCADYHAAVEKVLAEWGHLTPRSVVFDPHGFFEAALSELSAVHEKAKGLL